MVTITLSAAGAKDAVARLRKFLAVDGINLKQTNAYEALAQTLGYANWNTLQALLNSTAVLKSEERSTATLVLHQNGSEQHAPRVDESVVKAGENVRDRRAGRWGWLSRVQKAFPKLERVPFASRAALTERRENNTLDPDREPPLRRFIDAVIKGQPNLDDLSPRLIAATSIAEWGKFHKEFEEAGALKSLVFRNVDPRDMDIYMATFENRQVVFHVGPLTSDHKMERLIMRPPS